MISDRTEHVTPEGEISDTLHGRDAIAVSQYEVPFHDAADFLENLARDFLVGAITQGFVRLAVVSESKADINHVLGRRYAAGGERTLSGWCSKYVRCSYKAWGELAQVSLYCGPATVGEPVNRHAKAINEETAKVIQTELRRLRTGIARHKGLEVRGGGIYVAGEFPMDDPDARVEPAPGITCATCGVVIHWANNAWRDAYSQPDVLVDTGRFRPGGFAIKRLDHLHDPDEAGKLVA